MLVKKESPHFLIRTSLTLTGCTCFVGASVGNHEGAGVGSADVGTTDGIGETVGSAVGESVAMIPGAILSGGCGVSRGWRPSNTNQGELGIRTSWSKSMNS